MSSFAISMKCVDPLESSVWGCNRVENCQVQVVSDSGESSSGQTELKWGTNLDGSTWVTRQPKTKCQLSRRNCETFAPVSVTESTRESRVQSGIGEDGVDGSGCCTKGLG